MKESTEDKIIKDKITKENNKELPLVSNLPRKLQDWIETGINHNNKNISIHSLRIVFVLLALVKNRQIKNKQQLQLFEEEWFDITKKTANNVSFENILLKNFLPIGSKNYKHVLTGFDELVGYVTKESFIHEDGNVTTLTSSIISNLIHDTGKRGIKFEMNAYWFKVFLNINDNYNKVVLETIFKISELNALRFYLFLQKIKGTGTTLLLETLNDIFRTNHKYWSKAEERLLKPIKKDLDLNSELSFNYVIRKNVVEIITYKTQNSVPILSSEEDYRIDKAIRFRTSKHALDKVEKEILRGLYRKYGYDFVYNTTSRKKELKDLKGKMFLEKFHSILTYYFKSKK